MDSLISQVELDELANDLLEFYPERADLQALVTTPSRTGERKSSYQAIANKTDLPCQIVPLGGVERAGSLNYSQSHSQSTHVCVLGKRFSDITPEMRLQVLVGPFAGIYNIIEVKTASFAVQTLLEIQLTK